MRQVNDLWKQGMNPTTLGERIAARLVVMYWEDSPERPGYPAGLYTTEILGTRLQIPPFTGPYAGEHAERRAVEAYRLIAEAIDSALPDDVGEVAAKQEPKVEVYSRSECVFNYCPYVVVCREEDRCLHEANKGR